MNDDATMNELAGKYEGMTVLRRGKAIVRFRRSLLVKSKNIYTALIPERTDVAS